MISGAANGSVTEAGGVDNGTPGAPTATGNLNSTDVDNSSDLWDRRQHADRERQRLRHLHADGGRRLDLHAGQQQPRRAGAQCRPDADRHVHGLHGRRHRPGGDHHHQRHQRCRRDHRRHDRDSDRGRRRRQRYAGHADRDRRSELHRRRQSGRRLDRGRHGDRQRQRLRHLHADSGRRCGPTRWTTATPPCRRSMPGRR